MTTYYRTTDGARLELTTEQYAALAQSKRDILRLWIVDAKPTPTAAQTVIDGGIVVGPTEAHQTWALRDKTASELESDSLQAELATIGDRLAELVAQRAVDRPTWDAYTANQLHAEQWRDRQALLRFAHFLARRAKREIAS